MLWKKLLFLFALLSFIPLFAKDSTWVHYWNGAPIHSISHAFENDSIGWIINDFGNDQRGRLVKQNINSNKFDFIEVELVDQNGEVDSSGYLQYITKVKIDSDKLKWLLIPMYGLVSYNDTSFVGYNGQGSNFEMDIFLEKKANDLAIDRDGKKWVAANQGLGVYDGETWTVYDSSNSIIPNGTFVSCVAIDKYNRKWIAVNPKFKHTEKSNRGYPRLLCFNDTTWTLHNTPYEYVKALAIDDTKDEIWIHSCCGDFKKTYKFDGENFTDIDFGAIGDNFGVNFIDIDQNGVKWIGSTGNGLICYDHEISVYDTTNTGLKSNYITSFAIDLKRCWWIGNYKGMMSYDGEDAIYYIPGINGGLPSNDVYNIAFDNNNVKWILTKKGLTRFDDYEWENIAINDTVRIYGSNGNILFDNNNNLWINCPNFFLDDPGYGLYRYNGEEWINYNTENSDIPTNNTTKMAIENGKILWISSYDFGIVKYNILTNEWTVYNAENSNIPNNKILSIAIDHDNNKWIGTKNGGLVYFNDQEWTVYNTENSNIPSNYISSIVIDNNDRKWFTSHPEEYRDLQEIVVFDDENFTIYNDENSPLASAWNHVLAVDLNGKAWIYSSRKLFSFDGSVWEDYTNFIEEEGGDYNSIASCKVDKYNNKWVCTLGCGLFVYNEGGVVGIEEEEQDQNLPKSAKLFQNYPNPFNPSTTISYNLVKPSNAQIKVFNILGQQIWESSAKMQKAGTHSLVFDASRFGSNIYFYRLEVNGEVADTKKMIFLK